MLFAWRMQVLFSSVAALLGSPGQANYAAANAAIGSFAHGQQSRGLRSQSIQWGAWEGAGIEISPCIFASDNLFKIKVCFKQSLKQAVQERSIQILLLFQFSPYTLHALMSGSPACHGCKKLLLIIKPFQYLAPH